MEPNRSNDYWQQDGADEPQPQPEMLRDDRVKPLNWRASEYIYHDKQIMWFVGLGLIAVMLILVALFLIKSYTFVALVVVMTIAVGYLAGRPPSEVSYQLSSKELVIAGKHFSLHDFSSFGVVNHGPLYSIVLTPTQRFMPRVNIYFPENMGEPIVDVLGAFLPMREVKQDFIDQISHKLRF